MSISDYVDAVLLHKILNGIVKDFDTCEVGNFSPSSGVFMHPTS